MGLAPQKPPTSHPTAIAAYVRCNCCAIVISPFSPRRNPLFTSSLGGNCIAVSILLSFNLNVIALTGRRNGGVRPIPQGAALGYMQLRFQRALLAIALVLCSSCGVLAATFAQFRAPKGQLPPARGNTPGICTDRENAPCKGSYITQHAPSIIPYQSVPLHFSILPSFNLSVFAARNTANERFSWKKCGC